MPTACAKIQEGLFIIILNTHAYEGIHKRNVKNYRA